MPKNHPEKHSFIEKNITNRRFNIKPRIMNCFLFPVASAATVRSFSDFPSSRAKLFQRCLASTQLLGFRISPCNGFSPSLLGTPPLTSLVLQNPFYLLTVFCVIFQRLQKTSSSSWSYGTPAHS